MPYKPWKLESSSCDVLDSVAEQRFSFVVFLSFVWIFTSTKHFGYMCIHCVFLDILRLPEQNSGQTVSTSPNRTLNSCWHWRSSTSILKDFIVHPEHWLRSELNGLHHLDLIWSHLCSWWSRAKQICSKLLLVSAGVASCQRFPLRWLLWSSGKSLPLFFFFQCFSMLSYVFLLFLDESLQQSRLMSSHVVSFLKALWGDGAAARADCWGQIDIPKWFTLHTFFNATFCCFCHMLSHHVTAFWSHFAGVFRLEVVKDTSLSDPVKAKCSLLFSRVWVWEEEDQPDIRIIKRSPENCTWEICRQMKGFARVATRTWEQLWDLLVAHCCISSQHTESPINQAL